MDKNETFHFTGEQQIEYNTVILAGLLHDVGKFVQRIETKQFKKHPLVSVDFIKLEEVSAILSKEGLGIDLELLKTLVQHHHEDKRYFPANQLVQSITDPRQRALAYLVSQADTFSSYERDDEEERAFEYRLYSTFSSVNITDRIKPGMHYDLREFSPETMFPVEKDKLDREIYSYENLERTVREVLKKFSPGNFDELFNGFLTIFKKFLWAVPSDTWKKKSDISLFDHLSTTSAIAASLYGFHCGDLNENQVKKKNTEKFLLVGGDLSGIQDFLFEIHAQNPRKLSKTLRGRSFLLSLAVEMVSLKILKALKLPFSAKLMSSGGRFVILAPNLDWVKDTLDRLAVEIEEEFFRFFLGKLTLMLNYKTVLKGEDMSAGSFKDKINENNAGLIVMKLNKHRHVLKSGAYREMLNRPHGHSIQESGVCSFCGVFPKEKPGKDEKCMICNISEDLGEKILDSRFLHFTDEPGIFWFLNMGVDLSGKYSSNILSYVLEEDWDSETYSGSIFHSIANYLPKDQTGMIRFDDEETETDKDYLCDFCGAVDPDRCTQENRRLFKDTHLPFECIAAYSPYRRKRDGSREAKCVNKLAVFKADIDNVGYIMQNGFEKLNDDETCIYSVSRYTFVSRMIDSFFQYGLKQFIKEKFPMIYTVYAGGDDMLLIGPWLEVVDFSKEFHESFKEFMAHNPDITLSAGISLFSPRSPVPGAVEKAQVYLETAKDMEGKNAVSLFDTTVHWDRLPKLMEFAEFLDESINTEESRIKTAFLFRLFKYRAMFLESEQGKVEGLRFHSLMNYDIVRNIEKKKGDLILNREELEKLKPLYSTGEALDKELLRDLKIPLCIALLENRGGR